MTSTLFVVSEEGYWAEECIEPLTALGEAGVDVEVATPTGSPPVVDERSVDPDAVGQRTAREYREAHESDERLQDPTALADVNPAEYDAVVFPGGHGTQWDVTQDHHARAALRTAVETDGMTALVVCHAVGLLAFTRDSEGEFLVDGRSVTGFPNEWERNQLDDQERLPDGRKLPYWVEDEVRAAGGEWDAELDAEASVTVDGDLITARGPDSSAAAAATLLDALGVED